MIAVAALSGLKILSITACALLVTGYLNRKRRGIHIPLVVSAFVIDMAIVLYIEISRGALEAAQAKMGPLMIVHITLSVITILLYFGQIVTGIRKLRGKPSAWHGVGGRLLLLFRFGNLVTSFLVT